MTGCAQHGIGPHRAARGFTLIEVLIALVVMSVGMFGIAGLYLHSIQAGRTSVFRHQAVTLAGDVADRIRSNPTAGDAYESEEGRDNGCMSGTAACTPEEMAENDVFTWNELAGESLPGGAVAVTYTDSGSIAPDAYRVQITWSEPGFSGVPSYSIDVPVNNFGP